ncbi:sensor histidine kinase [Inhella gelatinilytica]|uniref:histidine kinase n=1 Tax=Inhella gelatinilytica TaxID=2795030 RepID=A0A931NCH5_9BURK|nr:HAMP domain-containing sensor histidine kinase [Inhella gelatinilytica]MBH9552017.1 HAMP domain-containing histidine kinase [Inhella gelatinilytica]
MSLRPRVMEGRVGDVVGGVMDRLPRLPLAAFARRVLLRAVFLALLAGSAALALQLLTEEKQRQRDAYEAGFRGQLEVLAERLRHPSGQLALLNPSPPAPDAQGWAPLRLPVGAIDFDDASKAERVMELSGCATQWDGGQALCLGVGRRASAGAFVYAIARVPKVGELRGRGRGQRDLTGLHHVQLTVRSTAGVQAWLAPLELRDRTQGQLPGFERPAGDTEQGLLSPLARPDRDFRGWLWRPACGPDSGGELQADCPALLSLRVPVAAWRDTARSGPWPPSDLDAVRVQLRLLGPEGQTLLDTQQPDAHAPPDLHSLRTALRPGEVLTLTRAGAAPTVLRASVGEEPAYPWLTRLIRRLPAARLEGPLQAERELLASEGRLHLRLTGDLRALDRELAATATRYLLYFALLAGAIALAWLIVELGLLRRMALLTRRANALTRSLQAQPDELPALDVADLRGRDELGILAGSLSELLARSREHLRGEQRRAEQAHEQWHAVGHEIMSPLQSLLALHAAADDPSRRYLLRMQAALNLLYGQASVGEALDRASAQRERLDLAAFAREVAANAPYAGIADVHTEGATEPLWVWADPLKLEDALTHVLTNAQRYRTPGSPITLRLTHGEEEATLAVHNHGPLIDAERLPTLFELGAGDAEGPSHRGQGLFVARSYLAKMGGRIGVHNEADGPCFTLGLARV